MSFVSDLQNLLATYRREGLSLLQYVRQTAPFAKKKDRPIAERIHQIAVEELKSLEEIALEIADAKSTVPSLGGFPSEFTNFNYFDVRKLIPYLIADHGRLIDALKTLVESDERTIWKRLLELKVRHLAELQSLTEPTPV